MKKSFLILVTALFFVSTGSLRAEDNTAAAPAVSSDAVVTDAVTAEPAENPLAAEPVENPPAVTTDQAESAPVDAPAVESTAPVPEKPEAVSAETVAPEPTAATEEPAVDNLEFISGEVSALDEPSKTLTVKLYGESENGAADKTLSVQVDEATDITDGEKDRELRSLTAGTEVDVEYDPATKKATYIFVY